LGTTPSDSWLNGVLDQLHFGGLGEKNRYIQDDLHILEATYQDGPEQLIDPTTVKGSNFKAKHLSVKIQFAVLQDAKVDEAVAKDVGDLLRDRPDNFADKNQFVTAATTLALTHFLPDAEPGHYTDAPSLTDIATAQEAINQSDQDALPAWTLKRWKQMSDKFFPDLTHAYDTDNELAVGHAIEQFRAKECCGRVINRD